METNGNMNPLRIARVTGVLFVITYITSIPPVLFLYGPLLDDPRYILGGGGADNGLSLGALLELILIIANIGTAVVLYPVVKRVLKHYLRTPGDRWSNQATVRPPHPSEKLKIVT